ncbi:MAG: hypothetical protein EZS28_055983 [Streblomastix strix]|uniref:Uncharacterized protein n=1 Tax=Streblomastix strix TaxID=222440 RepID=A0A5J4PU58_9EUKA|nr:MAG: hypothetical protein EZS28_055983 [Streblomastix strix]
MFECFVEQDLVSALSDLYHSLNFQNRTINEGDGKFYYGKTGNIQETENIFYNTTLCVGSKAVKVYYPHKFNECYKSDGAETKSYSTKHSNIYEVTIGFNDTQSYQIRCR